MGPKGKSRKKSECQKNAIAIAALKKNINKMTALLEALNLELE